MAKDAVTGDQGALALGCALDFGGGWRLGLFDVGRRPPLGSGFGFSLRGPRSALRHNCATDSCPLSWLGHPFEACAPGVPGVNWCPPSLGV